MAIKDNFSSDSKNYLKFRPSYPIKLYEIIDSISSSRENCWDCGTGNGQIATRLADKFGQVFATDISAKQISKAPKKVNINYSIQPAEKTDFLDHFFDLIVVAQAIHWFDFEAFYNEVRRVAKPNAHLIVCGYGLLSVDHSIDQLISHFYTDVVGPYWDAERKYIDEKYRTIPFPFREIETPKLSMTYHWNRDQFIGYLNTWSSVKHYIEQNKSNPIDEIQDNISKFWGEDELKKVEFPLLLRVGLIH